MANEVYLVDHTTKEYKQVYLSDDDEGRTESDTPAQEVFDFLWQRTGHAVTVEYGVTSQLNLCDGQWHDLD
jgi:hypothetical protein